MAISTNGTVLARLAGGLYNQTLSNATYAEVNAVVKTAADINALANDLYARDFASKTDLAVATTLVSNLGLSSTVGLNNWVAAQLTAAGAANKGAKIVSLLNDFANLTSDATYGAAATAFNNKAAAALALSQKAGSAGGDFDAAATLAAADAAAAAAAEAAAAAAKASADAAAKAAADAAAEAAAAAAKAAADKVAADAAAAENAAQSFTLTSGVNKFSGKAGDDSFDAALNANNQQTLTSVDVLVGGAGSDTLAATLNNGLTARPTLSGIETLYVTAVTNSSALDLASASGVTAISAISGSTQASVTSIGSTDVTLSAQGNTGAVVFGYTDAALVATGQTAKLTVDGQTGNVTIDDQGGANVLESLEINSVNTASSFTLAVNNVGTTTVVVKGDADLTLGTLPTKVTNVNASSFDGSLSATLGVVANATVTGGNGDDALTVDAVTGDVNLNAGAGDDTVTIATNLASTDTINGGDGAADVLVIGEDQASAAKFANVSGFEQLNLAGSSTDVTLSASIGIAKFDLTDSDDNILTLNEGYTGATTVVLTGDTSNSDKIVNSASVDLTVTANDADIDAGTTITGGTGTDVINLKATGGTATLTALTGVETINVLAGTNVASDINIDMGANNTQVAAEKTLNVDASRLTNSGAVLTFTGVTDETDGYVNVTGGAGNDVITVFGSTDTVSAGAGNDTVTIDTVTATNVLNGGDGTDALVLTDDLTSAAAAALAGVSGFEQITLGGSSTDLTLAAAISVAKFDLTDSDDNILTLSTGYTGATTVVLTGDTTNADKIVNSANVALTVTANDADIDAGTTITGGTGTDVINMTATGGTATITALTGVETITVLAGTLGSEDVNVVMGGNDSQIAAGKTLTINASAFTNSGAVLTVTGVTNETDGYLNVISGAGDDVITVYGSADSVSAGAGTDSVTIDTVTSSNYLNGGDGSADKLYITDDIATATAFAQVSGFETIYLSGSSTDLTLESAISVAKFDLTDSDDNILTLSTGYTGATTVVLTGDTTNADKIVNSANVALTVTANDADIDAGTTITGGTSTDVINLKATGGTATLTALTGVETITIVAGSTVTDDVNIDLGANNTQISTGKTLTINGSALTDAGAILTVTGVTNETDGYMNIIGGNGNDVFTGSGNADTFTLGAGTDTVTLLAHAGGKFVFDTITDIATGDILNFADKGTEAWAATTAAASKITLASLAGFTDYLDACAAGDGSSNGLFAWFVYAGDTYVTQDKSSGATFVSGTDIVVKLTGTWSLTSSAVGDHIITITAA